MTEETENGRSSGPDDIDGRVEPSNDPAGGAPVHRLRASNGSEVPAGEDFLARRIRRACERTWNEAAKLATLVLDPVIGSTSGFAATSVALVTTVFFFAVSLVISVGIGFGGLVLFLSLECLALLAYAYPGALFLFSVAGGIVPPIVLYWALHAWIGPEGGWITWAPYPLLLVGLWGSYYYWRFGRALVITGAGALAFYRGASPKAGEIFGVPFAILAGLWDAVMLILRVFRGIARELLSMMKGRRKGPVARPEPARKEEPAASAGEGSKDS